MDLNRREFGTIVAAAAVGAAVEGCAAIPAGSRGSSILVLGAGFGGITAARELRAALPPEHRVTIVDRKASFQMGLRKVWILAGLSTRQDGARRIDSLKAQGIEVRNATVTAIDTAARRVTTDGGDLAYDFLVVALGAEARPELVPGWSDAVHSLYDPADCERLAPVLQSLRSGRVSVAILGTPYPCPPAPYEAAMTLDGEFHKRGVRDRIELRAWTPQPMSLPMMGKAISADFEGRLASRGIGFRPAAKTLRLEGRKAVLEKETIESDVLIIAPPHRPPAVVKQSGLAGAGEWIPIDRATMKTPVPRVWAVGDCTEILLENRLPVPKAGVIAESQARVAAAGILAEITGSAPLSWEGRGYCFIEHGRGDAAKAGFDLLAEGGPKMTMPPADAAAYLEKKDFEATRLRTWFE